MKLRFAHPSPITLSKPRPSNLALKIPDLVAKHHDLELLELRRAETQRGHRQRTPKQQVQHRNHHAAASLTRTRRDPTLRSLNQRKPTVSHARRDYVPHGSSLHHPLQVNSIANPSFEGWLRADCAR